MAGPSTNWHATSLGIPRVCGPPRASSRRDLRICRRRRPRSGYNVRPPWCGECEDEQSRTITIMTSDGSEAAVFCPRCSPQAPAARPEVTSVGIERRGDRQRCPLRRDVAPSDRSKASEPSDRAPSQGVRSQAAGRPRGRRDHRSARRGKIPLSRRLPSWLDPART